MECINCGKDYNWWIKEEQDDILSAVCCSCGNISTDMDIVSSVIENHVETKYPTCTHCNKKLEVADIDDIDDFTGRFISPKIKCSKCGYREEDIDTIESINFLCRIQIKCQEYFKRFKKLNPHVYANYKPRLCTSHHF